MDKEMHPDDLELTSWIDGELERAAATRLATHVESCEHCRSVVNSSGPALGEPDAPAVSWRGVSLEFAEERDRTPEMGEVWRAVWDDVGELVVIVDFDDRDPVSAPVVLEPPDRDETATWWPAARNPFGSNAVVFWGLRLPLPPFVFDAYLGPGPAKEEPAAFPGSARSRPDSALLSWRAHLGARMAALSGASWLSEPGLSSGQRLTAALREAGVSVVDAAHALDVRIREITSIDRGTRRLSEAERERLSTLGVDASGVGEAVQIDPGLAEDLSVPRWKPPLRRRMAASHTSEASARRQVAEEVLQLAARTTGPSSQRRDWAPLIQMVLEDA